MNQSTSPIHRALDQELVDNLVLSASVCRTIILAGTRQFDRFMLSAPTGEDRVLGLERLCHESLNATATWHYEPNKGLLSRVLGDQPLEPASSLPDIIGSRRACTFNEALDAFSLLTAPNPQSRYILIVDASFLLEDASNPREADFRTIRALEHYARTAPRTQTLILRVARTTNLPSMIVTSPSLRAVHIPAASRDVRFAYARRRAGGIAGDSRAQVDVVARTLSDVTEDWPLERVEALIKSAEQQKLSDCHDLEELARAIRLGAAVSPWAGERIKAAVARAEEDLSARVIGQPAAIATVVSALKKAVVGLSTAHQGQASQAPRAVLFFAGPTGTGKTELAKAISQLVFGQEQLLRFDCGELRQEHAVARLIGAPPGYVGYDRGGELTEGIRAKPNSVVLFDEIEKAHPRLLDTLLGVLDDGRLTSGQGETAYFGQSVIIFTSNLGIYEEVSDENGIPTRQPRFDYETPYDVIQQKVREAIREEFTTRLGRPELLGRFGGAESIVVFDYLRDLESVFQKFVANIAATCKRMHGFQLRVDTSLIEHVIQEATSRPSNLVLGGRGLKSALDRALTEPLADYVFKNSALRSSVSVSRDGSSVCFTPD